MKDLAFAYICLLTFGVSVIAIGGIFCWWIETEKRIRERKYGED